MKKTIKISPLTNEKTTIDQLQAALSASPFDFIFDPNLSLDDVDFIITDTNFLGDDTQLLQKYASKTFLLSDKPNEHNVRTLLAKFPINHLIGMNGTQLILELKDNLLKKIKHSIWGIEQYLGTNAEYKEMLIDGNAPLAQQIDEMINSFSYENYFDSPVDYLRVMANELLTNALYHHATSAPKAAIFKMGVDTSFITLSVQDAHGQLDREKIIVPLTRGFAEKTYLTDSEGAGLGLYLTYCHSNQLIFNHKKNVRSEVISIIDCNKRYKKYKERITSFHYSEEVEQ